MPEISKALLSGAIDYAGCFPPASLCLRDAEANYLEYLRGSQSWMLGRFVVRRQDGDAVSSELDGHLSVVGGDNARASAVEVAAVESFGKLTYCEVAPDALPSVKLAGSYGKLRTGGVIGAAIPDTSAVLAFVLECTRLRLPFKATAGLHHAIRGVRALTYDSGSARACMHGFLNILIAACWLWHGGLPHQAEGILNETDPHSFAIDTDRVRWRDCVLNSRQIESARRDFVHSFGSCSFLEPIQELQELGWL